MFSPAQIAVTASTSPELTTTEADGRDGQSLAILDCDVDLYLGATNAVTSATGALLPAHTPYTVDLDTGERVFARGAATGTVHVIRTGV